METDLEQQALTVRSMLSRHDMDDLIAPLLPAVVGSGSDLTAGPQTVRFRNRSCITSEICLNFGR
jgi:hypothetical protein